MADERFSGDMSRNEVEMDLSKFMEMIQENSALKDEIRDLKANDTVNPCRSGFTLQEQSMHGEFDKTFLTVYIVLVYYANMWFMELPEPSMEQSGLISILVGRNAWFGLYVNSAAKEHDTNANNK